MEPTVMVRSQFFSLICAEPQSGKGSMPTLKSRKMFEKSANSRYGLNWTNRSHIRKQNVLANGATKAAATAIACLAATLMTATTVTISETAIPLATVTTTTSEAAKALVDPAVT